MASSRKNVLQPSSQEDVNQFCSKSAAQRYRRNVTGVPVFGVALGDDNISLPEDAVLSLELWARGFEGGGFEGGGFDGGGKLRDSSNQNMRGVFLHVLADTMGSVGAIASSLLARQLPDAEKRAALEEAFWAVSTPADPRACAAATALACPTPPALQPRYRYRLPPVGVAR